MTKKPRDNRVPIMLSEVELTAIDDWRFANKIATRSDAIRRLAQIGIRADARVDEIANASKLSLWSTEDVLDHWLQTATDHADRVDTMEYLNAFERTMRLFVPKAHDRAADAYASVLALLGQIRAFNSSPTFAAALEEAEQRREKAEQLAEERRQFLDRLNSTSVATTENE